MKVCPDCGGTYPVAEGFCPMDGARLREPPQGSFDPRSLVGQVFDRRYRVDELVGEGGMGLVYRATHTLIGKSLAIKILRPEHLDDEEVGRRFLQEARLASAIKHPNVVDISDFGVHENGAPYYVMELLGGRTLAKMVDEGGPVPPTEAMAIALQILAGLEAAHEQGIVHRDLKPDNVFLVERDHMPLVKLLDFGIARAGPRKITVLGALLGTPEYMAPEQARGQDVDSRADLYAVGIILFEMLTGRPPFRHRELATVIEMHVHQPPPHLAELAPARDLPRTDALLQRLLAKDREQRPRDAGATMALLQTAMEQDLGTDTAERVRRTTRALGSGAAGRGGTAVPSTGRWAAPRGWTGQNLARVVPAPEPPTDPPVVIAPAPEPAPVLGARRKNAALPIVALGLGAAAVAAGLTFGVVRLLQTRGTADVSAAEPEGDPGDEAPAAIAGLDGTPASVQVAPGAPIQQPAATTASAAADTPPVSASPAEIDPKSTDDRLRPPPTKKKKAQGAKPTNAPDSQQSDGAQDPPPLQKPKKPAPPKAPSSPSSTSSKKSGKVAPGDLKDPFSSN